MSEEYKKVRRFERTHVSLPGIVHWRKNKDVFWKESTEIVSISHAGAGFNLRSARAVGSIISLTLNMPKKLRRYDLDKKLYRIWGLIQYCIPINDERYKHQVGVAFLGKNVPRSYLDDPFRSYKISGIGEDGFWSLGEAKVPYVERREIRLDYSVKVRLAKIDPEGNEVLVDEEAETENISVREATVVSTLDVKTGDWISFICRDPEFSSLAIIRDTRDREDGQKIIQLEFMEFDYPVEEL